MTLRRSVKRYIHSTMLLWMPLLTTLANQALAQKQGQAKLDSLLAEEPRYRLEDTFRSNLLYKIASQYAQLNPQSGIDYARRSLELAQRLQWQRGAANAYIALGNCLANLGSTDSALGVWQQGLIIFKELDEKAGILKIVGNIGTVYERQGQYAKALQQYFEALRYAEDLEDKRSIMINLLNISTAYNYLKDQEKSLRYNFKSLQVARQLNDTLIMAVLYGNAGNIFTERKQADTALKYQQMALSLNRRISNVGGYTRDLANVGTIYSMQGRHDDALTTFFSALDAAQENNLKPYEANITASIALALLNTVKDSTGGQPISAALAAKRSIPGGARLLLQHTMAYFNKAIALNREINEQATLMQCYDGLADVQQRLGLYREALLSRNLFVAYKDSVFSLESKTQIANIEARRELELKQKEIELANKQIALDRLAVAKKRNERVLFAAAFALLLLSAFIVLRNLRLKNAKRLSESQLTALRAQMNPHFVFNSLNSIQECIVTAKYSEASRYLNKFSKLFRMLLHNSGRPVITLDEEIEVLEQYLALEHMRFDQSFDYRIDVDPELEPSEIRVPSMLLQPFVENALWHGLMHKEGPRELSIAFEALGEDRFRCTISDNGIGREKAAALKAARSAGARHESMGMKITADRLTLLQRQGHQAAIRIEDRKQANGEAAGTTVVVELSTNITSASTTAS